jgi:hypothetical protein
MTAGSPRLTVPEASSILPKRSHQSESLFKMIGEVPVVIAATHGGQIER